MEAATGMSATRAALFGLIDHAALFPPASMSMADALTEDGRVRAAPTGWIVNRFVVPASRLAELSDAELRLSVVVDADARVVPLPDPRVEAFEVPPGGDAGALASAAGEVYVELAPDGDSARIGALRDLGLRAKVRCGGTLVPSVESLAVLIRTCRESGVPFKATAGLHHPVRHLGEHGFLNLLAAAVFGDEEAALAEEDTAAFALDREAFRWRDRVAAVDEIRRVRRELFVAFGSCSVQEPVDELHALGVLPS